MFLVSRDQTSQSWIYEFTPNEGVEEGNPLETAKIGPVIHHISDTVQERR